MISVLIVVVAACAFGIVASVIFSWASGKSPLWNIGFAVAIVLASAAFLLTVVVLLVRLVFTQRVGP